MDINGTELLKRSLLQKLILSFPFLYDYRKGKEMLYAVERRRAQIYMALTPEESKFVWSPRAHVLGRKPSQPWWWLDEPLHAANDASTIPSRLIYIANEQRRPWCAPLVLWVKTKAQEALEPKFDAGSWRTSFTTQQTFVTLPKNFNEQI